MILAPTNQSNSNPAIFSSNLSEYFVIQDGTVACHVICNATDYTGIKCSTCGAKMA